MELQQRPEPWMCMPLAFAMALDMPVADLLAAIGHDGSEIVFPSLPEPLCRRCFHIQELIQVALSRGLRRHAGRVVPRAATDRSRAVPQDGALPGQQLAAVRGHDPEPAAA